MNEGLEAFNAVLNDFQNADGSVLELVTEEEQEMTFRMLMNLY